MWSYSFLLNYTFSNKFSSRIPGLRIPTQNSTVSTPRQETILRPKERVNTIREQIEATLARQKEQDHHWEDQIDVSLFSISSYPHVLTW
jgi:hypothetical protein